MQLSYAYSAEANKHVGIPAAKAAIVFRPVTVGNQQGSGAAECHYIVFGDQFSESVS